MRLTWYGTAGFRFEVGERIFLIDPYLNRSEAARPVLQIYPEEVTGGSEIHISHGHFDHMYNVPEIAHQTGAMVYCAEGVASTLRRLGVDDAQIVVARDGDAFDHGAYQAECFNSTHIKFDLPLLATTLCRSLLKLGSLLPLLREICRWPGDQVLAWRFTPAAEDGRVVQHLGSAGCTEDELTRLRKMGSPDVLLVSLQGHTHTCRIAAHIVERLRPRLVIPHHHDDFCPPISRAVDIASFVEAVSAISPPPEVVQLPMGEAVEV